MSHRYPIRFNTQINMKKILLILIMFALFSCNKDEYLSNTKKYEIRIELIPINKNDSTTIRCGGSVITGVGAINLNIEEGNNFWYSVNSNCDSEYTLKIYKENNEKKSISNVII